MMKKQVVIGDSYALARDAIKALLATAGDFVVVGEAYDGREAVRIAAEAQPDLVLVQASMPGMRNYAAVRAMRGAGVHGVIVVIARHSTSEDETLAHEAGADGYIPREVGGAQFLETVRSLCADERPPVRIEKPGDADLEVDGIQSFERLSARERETLRLVVQGWSSAAIARELNLSPKSVDTYRSRIMAKLGVSGVPALVKLALQHGVTTFN
ncbi:MAG TPA: response regulator transcription factor [Burkholderiales bacterium]|nr:response regulator transcription factor [Burkholderiales bacterium]